MSRSNPLSFIKELKKAKRASYTTSLATALPLGQIRQQIHAEFDEADADVRRYLCECYQLSTGHSGPIIDLFGVELDVADLTEDDDLDTDLGENRLRWSCCPDAYCDSLRALFDTAHCSGYSASLNQTGESKPS